MVCPYCGGEINNSEKCEYCGRHITYRMRREIENLNKKGCPKCRSSNVTFRREEQGEVWNQRSRKYIHRTVGLCSDCGHTWYTDKNIGGYDPTPPKSWNKLWIVAIFFIIFLLLRSCGGNQDSDSYHTTQSHKSDETTTSSATTTVTEATTRTEITTESSHVETTNSEKNTDYSYLSIAPIEQKSINIENAEILTFSGDIKYEDQDDIYTFTPSIDGIYRIELSEIHNNHSMKISIFNSEEERVGYAYAENGEGETLVLQKNTEYKIHISYYSGFSPYILSVAKQKKATDISDYTLVTDSIEFNDQDNVYSFVVPISGRYRFSFTEIRENKYLRMSIYNHLGERIKNDYPGNNEGVTIDLSSDEKYSIHISEESGYITYYMTIGRQKEIIDISEYEGVNDSIEFDDQDNIYQYSPPVDGNYVFSFSELVEGKDIKISVYNRLNERIKYGYCDNTSTLVVDDMNANETYQIHVQEENGFSPYTMTIRFQ